MRRHSCQQSRVVGDKRQIHILFTEYQGVLVGFEFNGAAEMRLIHFSVYRSSLKLHALRIHRPSSASARDANNPRETHVHQQRRLFLVCEEPHELDGAFIAPTNYTNFLWTSQLFVARQSLDSVPKRPRGE